MERMVPVSGADSFVAEPKRIEIAKREALGAVRA
jgi:hypothetical protein